jgi:ABC-type transport system involved in multi-copper enzyme maturation permease subunit
VVGTVLGLRGLFLLTALAAVIAAGFFGVPWPIVGAAALVVVMLAVFWTVRGDGAELLGPICWYDLLRLARQPRTILLRCLYPLLLLAVLHHVYRSHFPDYDVLLDPFRPGSFLAPSVQAEIGRGFVTAILMMQGLAVLLLTPVYLAGAVVQERERRTLELLFTTHLRDHEIVLGKLTSRLGHLAVILLSSVPVLVLAEIFGGVDLTVVIGGSVAAVASLFSVGCLSMLCSTLFRRTLMAVLATYTLSVSLYVGGVICYHGLSPITFVWDLEQQIELSVVGPGDTPLVGPEVTPWDVLWPMLLPCLLVHGSLALATGGLAVVRMRTLRRHETIGRASTPRRRTRPVPALVGGPNAPRRSSHRPPVSDRPLLWKEMHIGPVGNAWFRALASVLRLVGAILVGLLAFEAMACYLLDQVTLYESLRTLAEDSWPVVNHLPRLLLVLFGAAWCLCAAYQASSSVGEERDRGTLDGLLTLPVRRRAILSAKWYGSLLWTRYPGYFLAAVVLLGFLMGYFDPLMSLILLLALVAHVTFLTSLGLWLSVVCRKTVVANLTVALLILMVWPAAWWWTDSEPLGRGRRYQEGEFWPAFGGVALNPLRTWWVLGCSREESPRRYKDWEEVLDVTSFLKGSTQYQEDGRTWYRGVSTGVTELQGALFGPTVFVILGAVFWRLACQRFYREPRRRAVPARVQALALRADGGQ